MDSGTLETGLVRQNRACFQKELRKILDGKIKERLALWP